MVRPHRSDRSTRGLVRLRDWTAARRHRQDPESGQATIEFALILIPLLILVVGIIQFGIGLNYWLDMNRTREPGRTLGGRQRVSRLPSELATFCRVRRSRSVPNIPLESEARQG